MTYEQIAAANKTLKTTDVKGKPYIEVNQRIKAFRMVYPTGFITTEMISNVNGVCVFKATCGLYTDQPRILGTGWAFEREDSTYINKTSYIENCETSAVGRALGMAGFGIDTAVASAEEVQNAINNQQPRMITPEQIEEITKLIDDIPKMLKYFKVKTIEELTEAQAKAIIEKKRSNKK